MGLHQTRLWRRNHTYYVRVCVPKKLQSLTKQREIKYTLGTNDYYEALYRLRQESAKIDTFLEGLRMKIRKDKSVELNSEDLTAITKQRLNEIEERRQNAMYAIKHNADPYNFTLFSKDALKVWIDEDTDYPERLAGFETGDITVETQEFQIDQMKKWLHKYWLEALKSSHINAESKEIIQKIVDGKAHLDFYQRQKGFREWAFIQFILSQTEEYALGKVRAIQNNEPYMPDEKIQMLVEAIKQEKIKALATAQLGEKQSHIHWTKVWDEFLKERRNKQRDPAGLDTQKSRLHRIFTFLGKEYIDDLTKDDCKKLNNDIYDWTVGKGKIISKKTVKNYITDFKTFMKFVHREHPTTLNACDFVQAPTNKEVDDDTIRRVPFSDEEVNMVFKHPLFVENRYDNVWFPKFWIPLIALYTGCRLNEIAQMEINDIKKSEEGIDLFLITDLGDERKKLKNRNSKRLIPIHPVLIKLGFLDFFEKVKAAETYRKKWVKDNEFSPKREKQIRNPNGLFFTLTYLDRQGYGNTVSKFVNETLLEEEFHIRIRINPLTNEPEKLVFHGLRHTFPSILNTVNTSSNTIEELLGWKSGKMSRTYIATNLKNLQKQVNEVSYPPFEADLSLLMPDPEKDKNFLK